MYFHQNIIIRILKKGIIILNKIFKKKKYLKKRNIKIILQYLKNN